MARYFKEKIILTPSEYESLLGECIHPDKHAIMLRDSFLNEMENRFPEKTIGNKTYIDVSDLSACLELILNSSKQALSFTTIEENPIYMSSPRKNNSDQNITTYASEQFKYSAKRELNYTQQDVTCTVESCVIKCA